jgi:hypothetical protein
MAAALIAGGCGAAAGVAAAGTAETALPRGVELRSSIRLIVRDRPDRLKQGWRRRG